jgi:predicted phosphodiesterase
LIDLEHDTREVIVVGDLHGAAENLRRIVSADENAQGLASGRRILIFLGDAVHNDQTGYMREMESSLETIEEVFSVILEHSGRVYYVRGNHDTFDERVAKNAIQQGKEFRQHLHTQRGKEYVDAVNEFFESLPLFVIGNGYVLTHAGPIRTGCTRQQLIDAQDNPDFVRQLTWNRLHEFRGTPSMKEYDEKDIRAMLRSLELSEDLPFIVGHNPMWQTGNDTGIWRDVIGIRNHIIIYTNLQTRAPYLLIREGKVEERFAIPKQQEKLYV